MWSEILTQNEVLTVCSNTQHDLMSVPCRVSSLMSQEEVRAVNVLWQMTDSHCERNWRLRISDMF